MHNLRLSFSIAALLSSQRSSHYNKYTVVPVRQITDSTNVHNKVPMRDFGFDVRLVH